MSTPPRTPETVTREIQQERDQLAAAVSNLRTELHEATDVRRILRTKWPQIVAVVTVAAGVIVASQVLRHRRREPAILARIGRLAVIDLED